MAPTSFVKAFDDAIWAHAKNPTQNCILHAFIKLGTWGPSSITLRATDEQLAAWCKCCAKTISTHLKILVQDGWLHAEIDGNGYVYSAQIPSEVVSRARQVNVLAPKPDRRLTRFQDVEDLSTSQAPEPSEKISGDMEGLSGDMENLSATVEKPSTHRSSITSSSFLPPTTTTEPAASGGGEQKPPKVKAEAQKPTPEQTRSIALAVQGGEEAIIPGDREQLAQLVTPGASAPSRQLWKLFAWHELPLSADEAEDLAIKLQALCEDPRALLVGVQESLASATRANLRQESRRTAWAVTRMMRLASSWAASYGSPDATAGGRPLKRATGIPGSAMVTSQSFLDRISKF